MNLGRDIEHGGYPTSETRTISMKRRDANVYAGIGRKARFDRSNAVTRPAADRIVQEQAMEKGVDLPHEPAVVSSQPPPPAAPETDTIRSRPMTLQFKSLSKNGKNAFYTGAANVIRIPLAAFPEKQAPETIEVADGVFAPTKQPKPKMTPEERKAARANAPKPTLAELAARAQARADKLAAQLAAAEQSGQGDAAEL